MPSNRTARRIRSASWLTAACFLVACSGSSNDSTGSTSTVPTPASTSSPPPDDIVPAPDRIADGPLAEVCPDRIVIQTDDLPTVRQGPLYHLLDEERIDDEGERVVGRLVRPNGTREDVELELRSGGPAIEFRSAASLLETDGTIHVAEAAFSELAPVGASSATAVAALAGTSDRMIMWDPARYPEIDGLDGLRTSMVEIRYVSGVAFIEFLVANGVLDRGQLVGGAESGVAGFITADGAIARQGDAVIDPLLFPALPQWSRPIAFAAASTRGWLDVDHLLATVPDRLAEDCLGRLVPIVQSAIDAYATDPGPANELMAGARNRFAPLNRVSAELLDEAAARGGASGPLLEEFTGVVGGVDVERLDAFMPALGAALDVELRALGDIIDERFLDPER